MLLPRNKNSIMPRVRPGAFGEEAIVIPPSHQLRYYIAPGAPPTRDQASGAESFLRPEVGFTPQWYGHHCGLAFGERWHTDPDVRMRGWERMRDELRRRFPGRNIGGSESGAPPDLLTGTFGGCVVSAIYGRGIQYWPDNWPASLFPQRGPPKRNEALLEAKCPAKP